MPVSRFKLYEETVQSPDWQVDYLPQFHQWLTGKLPLRFREDFCGSARIACEWVKRGPKHRALGLDLDTEVLGYARSTNLAALSPSERRRIQLRRQDVLRPTSEKVDWIGAFNYSIFTFHDRKTLVRYFQAAHRSLTRSGTLFLEIAGGPDFKRASLEKRTLRLKGVGRIHQAWEQQEFDPITGLNDYAIHFQLPDRTWMKDAFVYHWRIWNIPEIREALHDAGFRQSIVLLEKDPESSVPSNEFLPAENAPNASFFLAYVIGLK
jgi:hypothetical protein